MKLRKSICEKRIQQGSRVEKIWNRKKKYMKGKISNDSRKYEDMVYSARKTEKEKRRKKNAN